MARTGSTSQWKPLPEAERLVCVRFVRARKGTGLTQAEWGRKHGFSRDEVNNVELMRVPLKWGIAEKLIFADGVNPAWLGQGIKPEKRKGVLPLEVGRNAPKDGFFSEVYAAEIKPLITEQLRQAKIEEVGQALSGELASVESMIERGPKAGRPRAVIQDSTLRLLDLALQMPGNEVFNEAIRKLQLVAASLIESCKGETADAIVSRMEEVGALRERERMAERITPEKKRRKKGQGT